MGFASKGAIAPVTGSGSSASVAHGLTINSGDLVVAYVNRNGTSSISVDSGGAAFIEAVNEIPSGKTARQVLYWKIANSSEPASYGFTFGSSDNYQVLMMVFSSSSPAVVDSSAVTDITSGSSGDMIASSVNGAVISDNALSVIFAGKDNRAGVSTWTTVDNSYTGVIGKTNNQDSAGAYRVYTTGETFSGSVWFSNPGESQGDLSYSIHISFVEGSAGATEASYAESNTAAVVVAGDSEEHGDFLLASSAYVDAAAISAVDGNISLSITAQSVGGANYSAQSSAEFSSSLNSTQSAQGDLSAAASEMVSAVLNSAATADVVSVLALAITESMAAEAVSESAADASISISATSTLQPAAQAVIAGNVSIATVNDAELSIDTAQGASADFAVPMAVNLVASAVTRAELDVQAIQSVAVNGTTVIVEIVTPGSRVLKIEFDNRILVIANDNKSLTIH